MSLRPHQWVKNLLVFAPMIAAGALVDVTTWQRATIAFLAFCASASAIYLINDIRDIEADRRHPRKHDRPFASGDLPIGFGLLAAPVLIVVGTALALAVDMVLPQLAYITMSLAYTLFLKQRRLVDVFLLSGLYTIRLIGGGVATGYVVSEWLMSFSVFLFLALALVKRVGELKALDQKEIRDTGRGYMPADEQPLMVMGLASSFAAAIVLALYIQSDAVAATYAAPFLLWLSVPLVLYWLCRAWLITTRGQMHDDPIVFAMRDPVSLGTLSLFVGIHVLAKHAAFLPDLF